MSWTRRPLLLFAALLLAAAAVFLSAVTPKDPLADYRKVLRIGYANEPPYSFRTPDGDVTGEAPVAAKHAARVLGLHNVRFVLMDFGDLISQLEAGAIDVIAAGLFVTPGRAARVRFSRPTALVEQGLLVVAGNPGGVTSYEDVVRTPDARAAVLGGSVEEQLLQGLGMPPERLFAARDAATALSALKLGHVECLALSSPTVRYMALGSGGLLEAVDPFVQPLSGGRGGPTACALAFRKRDKALADAFDAALSGFIGSPAHLQLVEPLGFGPSSLPEARP